MVHIGETIGVMASFGPAYGMRPVRFKWSGRVFEVREVTYSWSTRDGASTVHHFSVSDGKDIYEITFNASSLVWSLEAVSEG